MANLPYHTLKNKTSIEVTTATAVNGIATLYSELTYFESGMREVWIIIDPATKTEMDFSAIGNYRQVLKRRKIKDPPLYPGYKLYTQFKETGKLPFK